MPTQAGWQTRTMAAINIPVVLVFSGSDPTGGAGIEADIETLTSLGCHAAPVITAVTAQDTFSLKEFAVMDASLVVAQARAVLEDIPVAAVKIGMLGATSVVAAVASILDDYPSIPVVLDPVLATNAGQPLGEAALEDAMRALLLRHTTMVTPNCDEARLLSPEGDSLDACGQAMLSAGCEYALITGTHDHTRDVVHRLYGGTRLLETYTFERLPGHYHGSGCTLASAIAGNLAHDLEPANAAANALDFTWKTLKHAHRLGMGQYIPDRMFWARDTDND